ASFWKSTVMVRFVRVWRAVLRMGHLQVRWLVWLMTQDGGKTAQLQGDHEGGRGFTTKFGGMCPGPLLAISSYALASDGVSGADRAVSSLLRCVPGRGLPPVHMVRA